MVLKREYGERWCEDNSVEEKRGRDTTESETEWGKSVEEREYAEGSVGEGGRNKEKYRGKTKRKRAKTREKIE